MGRIVQRNGKVTSIADHLLGDFNFHSDHAAGNIELLRGGGLR
jgi:hypothetical protein